MSSVKTASGAAVESENVKVAVRVRPLNARETGRRDGSAVVVRANQTRATVSMQPPPTKDSDRASTKATYDFQFDHVFWSLAGPDKAGAAPAMQADVYHRIGSPLVQHAFHGFNSCLFAYGQTGSGKTYTMMGANVESLEGDDAGVTPRICLEMFQQKAQLEAEGSVRWLVELGYVEIYNERVSDLLAKRKKGTKASEEVFVEIREHPTRGVFIEDQRFVEVQSMQDVVKHIESGNVLRHTAATKMNDRSSRSHAIVMLFLREERTITTKDGEQITTAGKTSRMNLVDLAGSERVAQSAAVGKRFTEATHINLSLTTLGRIIDILADMAKKGNKSQWSTPPYRESRLTYILKDSLGGNSKTFMVATVSPSAVNYDETLSTLRYASRARDIVNVAQVNEDPRARRIRELEEQMAAMRHDLQTADPHYVNQLEEKLALLQAETQKRAADLQALEKTREQNQLQERMLRATEAERKELANKAMELQKQVEDSRRQADAMAAQNMKLQEEQARKERELMEEMAKRDAALSTIKRRLANEIESGRTKLEQAVAALDKERQEREAALAEIQAHQSKLDAALRDTARSENERATLLRQNADLNAQREKLLREVADKEKLLRDLERAQDEADAKDRTNSLLQCALSEMEQRYHNALLYMQQSNDLLMQTADALSEQHTMQIEKATAQLLQQADTETAQHKQRKDQMQQDLDKQERQLASLRTELEGVSGARQTVEQELAAARDSGSALQREKADLEQQLTSLRTELEGVSGARQTVEQELAAARDSGSALQREKADLEQQLASLRTEVEAVTTSKNSVEHSYAVLKQSYDRLESSKQQYKELLKQEQARSLEFEMRLKAHKDRRM